MLRLVLSAAWIAFAGLPGFAVLILARAAMDTKTVTLTGPEAKAGELLDANYGDRVVRVVVRRVMDDMTGQHVVLVRPWKWWHRVKWARRWL